MTQRERIWNIPNILTMLRLALIGVFIWQFATGHRYWAMAVFLLAGITDFLDGYIARKRQLVTSFGKLMDPLADKLMLITALACLTIAGLVPLWLVIIVVLKELFMIVGGFLFLKRGLVVQAKLIGKVTTVVFLVAVVATFLDEYTSPWDYYLQCLACGLSVLSMFWYLVNTLHALRQSRA